jgi:hypothetical protein
MRKSLSCIVLVCSLTVMGCGSGGEHVPSGLNFIDVTGTVNGPDGKPLKSGSVHFGPLDPKSGRDELAGIVDGKFTLKMATGNYRVAFNMKNEDGVAPRSNIPAKYTKYDSSNLTTEIKSGMSPLAYDLK